MCPTFPNNKKLNLFFFNVLICSVYKELWSCWGKEVCKINLSISIVLEIHNMISRTSWESWTLKGKLHKEQLRKSCILAQSHANGAHSSVFSWRIASETTEPSCSNANEGDASMNSVIPGASKGDGGWGGAGGSGEGRKEERRKKWWGEGRRKRKRSKSSWTFWIVRARPFKNKTNLAGSYGRYKMNSITIISC